MALLQDTHDIDNNNWKMINDGSEVNRVNLIMMFSGHKQWHFSSLMYIYLG